MKNLAPRLSQFFQFELLRVLGTAPLLGCDVGEWVEATDKIKQDDPESWYRAWTEASETVEAVADEALRANDRQGALWALLRACNYRRASEFMLHVQPGDPRLHAALLKSSDNFQRALPLLDSAVEMLQIPYEGTTLPGYLFLPTASGAASGAANTTRPGNRTKTPLLVVTGGYDATQEELYFGMASGARVRGYACLVFEGPGQGVVARRTHGRAYLRPDWEVVIGAVLDHVFWLGDEKPALGLDLSRIALVGASMGGYFALRGATDARVSAVISIDGFYDLGDMMASRMPRILWPDRLGAPLFNWLLGAAQRWDFQTRFEFQHAMLATGAETPAEVYQQLARYRLCNDDDTSILDRVKCPALITGARDTLYWSLEDSTYRIFKALSQLDEAKDKQLWIPDGWGQGSLHAKVGAFSHLHCKMFCWLNHVFEINPDGLDRDAGGVQQK
ncbi:Alpha/Beta hydrolase protein [Chaetomium fimeti]|uniref:Alpha/Beta hydrolase protein n=1 Tax=Chaetomium fimeti TaxID=1854472 RepID=A0AAE0HHG2_9PEZI|nr:Alpha/Beta hydrolase protein [Chaetomium fimeti]